MQTEIKENDRPGAKSSSVTLDSAKTTLDSHPQALSGHDHDHEHDTHDDHDHGHDHGHSHDGEGGGWETRRRIEIGLAALLFGLGIIFNSTLHATPFAVAEYLVLITAYLLVGRGVVWTALRNLRQGQFFDENFLMSVATLGAIAIHLLPEAVAVMLFYAVGEYFQERAVNRSRRSIRALLDIRPDYANVERQGELVRVGPDTVSIDEIIAVKPGEKIPLDGIVIEGTSFVDTSALTGESVPRRITAGDTALAGTINTQGMLRIRVSRSFGESSVSKILQLVENASSRKAPTEAFISTFSRYYTPVVVVAAALLAILPPLLLPGATFSEWVYRALVLLVISCPCALVVSIPLGYFGGIGGASRRGILVKGANYLDALTQVDTVVMDKTGTLTKGVFKVTQVTSFNGFSQPEVMEAAAYVESHSSHPIATSIKAAYGQPVEESRLSQYQELAGHGIKAQLDGKRVLAGNDRLLHLENIPHETCEAEGTVVYVVIDEVLAGRIIIADEIKPDAAETVRKLHDLGVKRVVMLTGDDRKVAERVARQVGVDEVYAELLPEDKVATLEKIEAEGTLKNRARKGKVAFVGDGINDAPVLTRADVGIAMGGLGSDAAIEAADVVIMDDQPSKLATAIQISRHTRGIVIQNIVLALVVKTIFVILGSLGVATIWEAVFADVGVSLLAILNATRALRS